MHYDEVGLCSEVLLIVLGSMSIEHIFYVYVIIKEKDFLFFTLDFSGLFVHILFLKLKMEVFVFCSAIRVGLFEQCQCSELSMYIDMCN